MVDGWRKGAILVSFTVGAAVAGLVGIGASTLIGLESLNQEVLFTLSAVSALGALLIAALAIMFQFAFRFGRGWNALQNQQETVRRLQKRIEQQQEELDERQKLITDIEKKQQEVEDVADLLEDKAFKSQILKIWKEREEKGDDGED